MLRGRSIVCFSSIDWTGLWQGHQEIMSLLADAGNRVLYVEHTGTRRPAVRDIPRLLARLRNVLSPAQRNVALPPNVTVLSPLALPAPYNPIALAMNKIIVGRQLREGMRRAGISDPIAWVFLPTPLVLDLLPVVKPSLTIYHNVDDFSSASPEAARIQQSEERLLREADLVFVTSQGLGRRAGRLNRNVHLFRSGVNFARFDEGSRRRPADEPSDIRGLKKPLVGYVGNMHKWVDLDLVASVAKAMPDVTFVFVGPRAVDVSILAELPNVVMVGPKVPEELPSYIRSFGAALIPYRRAPYTEHVFPAKLNEYLAMGTPVVSTPLPEIESFAREHGPVVAFAESASGFVTAIREALAEPSDSPKVERRRAVARAYDWTSRVEAMSACISHV